MPGVLHTTILILLIVTSSLATTPAPWDAPDQGEPARPVIPAWRFDSLLDDAGLNGFFIFDIDFDDANAAWIATADGLHRYDGLRWRRFGLADGLPSEFVRSVCCAASGDVWIGTDRGVAVWRDERFERFANGPMLAGPTVRRIVEEPDGAIWFCCDRWLDPEAHGGLSVLRDDRITTYTTEHGVPSNYVSDFVRTADGTRFVLTAAGLARQDGDRWIDPLAEAGLDDADTYVWHLVDAGDGELIATTLKSVFRRSAEGAWIRQPMPSKGWRTFKGLLATRAGDVLSLSYEPERALLRYDGIGFVAASEPLDSHGTVERLVESPDGAIWGVGYDLLFRIEAKSEWTAYDHLPPLQLATSDGAVWFADGAGGVRFDGAAWESFPDVRGAIVESSDGMVWGWTAHQVSLWRDGATRSATAEALGLARLSGLAAAGADAWVVGRADDGSIATCRIDATLTVQDTHDIAAGGNVHAVACGVDGTVAIAVMGEARQPWDLLRLDPHGALSTHRIERGTAQRVGVTVGDGGRIWIHGDFGLHEVVVGGLEPVAGMPGRNVIQGIARDDAVWFFANGSAGGRTGFSVLRDGTWHHRRCTGFGFHPADELMVVRGDGEIHRHGISGAEDLPTLHLPVAGLMDHAVMTPAGETWVDIGGRVLRHVPDHATPETIVTGDIAEIPAGEPLPIDFAARHPFRSMGRGGFDYSWRLNDGPWSIFGPVPGGGIEGPFRSGSNRLEVRARDQVGDVDPTPAVLDFAVVPAPIQSRWWFRPLVAGVIIALAALSILAWLSRRRLGAYAHDLERIVGERTARLSRSERRHRALVEHAPLGIVELDVNGRIHSLNAAGATMLEQSERTIVGGLLEDQLRSCSDESLAAAVAAALAGREREVECTLRSHLRIRILAWLVPLDVPDDVAARVMVILQDITERREAEDRQVFMMRELDHRVKNTLASVLSLADQTARSAGDLNDFRSRFQGRIIAFARTHEMLAAVSWSEVELEEVLMLSLDAGVDDTYERVAANGPSVSLSSARARGLAMAFFELVTNATKHGALASPEGRINIRWEIALVGDDRAVIIDWAEHGGPRVQSPRDGGIGLELIRGLVRQELGGRTQLEFASDGLRCRLTIPVEGRDLGSFAGPDDVHNTDGSLETV